MRRIESRGQRTKRRNRVEDTQHVVAEDLLEHSRCDASAGVLAQTAVADAWSGPVPGSTPALSLAGQ
jgi:hypothetical protein